jgi:hypothetical protein
MCLLSMRIATRRDLAIAAQTCVRPYVYQCMLCSGTCSLVSMTPNTLKVGSSILARCIQHLRTSRCTVASIVMKSAARNEC